LWKRSLDPCPPWFLDDDFDSTVFRVAQAFFPVTDAWKKLQAVLRGTVDADLLNELQGVLGHHSVHCA
jgi:hypothetical protein